MAVTANLNWIAAAGAVSYKVEYKLQSEQNWTVFAATLGGVAATITGLEEGMAYDFRVTSNCASGTSAPTNLSDNTPCKNVSELTASFVGNTADLSWAKKTYAIEYTIEYKLQSAGSWTAASGSPLSNSGAPDPVIFSVAGLTPGEAYDFKVTVTCQQGTSPGATVSATSACIAPTGLTVVFS